MWVFVSRSWKWRHNKMKWNQKQEVGGDQWAHWAWYRSCFKTQRQELETVYRQILGLSGFILGNNECKCLVTVTLKWKLRYSTAFTCHLIFHLIYDSVFMSAPASWVNIYSSTFTQSTVLQTTVCCLSNLGSVIFHRRPEQWAAPPRRGTWEILSLKQSTHIHQDSHLVQQCPFFLY